MSSDSTDSGAEPRPVATPLTVEQQLFESQKLEALGRLAGGIAHDFNNMLLVILGSTSLLLDRKSESDPDWTELRAIEDAAERAASLTQQLLAVARRQVFTMCDVDLNETLRQMEDMLRRTVGDDVRFVLTLGREPLVVRADASQLHQVLLNLVINARDAMPEGGTLTITTRAGREADGAETAVVEVRDTGVGMSAETLAHVFEPFFSTKGVAGMGLGLATVYGIVTQSGGKVEAQSAPGQGAVFSVLLPRLATAAETPAAEETPEQVERGSGTILVVDDSELVLSLTSRILTGAGYKVMTAPSGEWAMSVARRHSGTIDLLLTDVMMPGMSGPQLARGLAAHRSGIRVLFMTGYQRDSVRGDLAVPPGAEILEKPFKPAALLRAVKACAGA
jgi:two-component system cell cycle sensor histidine kinase/response regulator CckA